MTRAATLPKLILASATFLTLLQAVTAQSTAQYDPSNLPPDFDPSNLPPEFEIPCAADPYADPANDPCNFLGYIPNKGVNVLAVVLYFLAALAFTWQSYRHRANYMLCLVIGTYCEAVGLVLRLVYRDDPHSSTVYVTQVLFVVLSPCAFLAADYILLGRLVGHLDAPQYLRPFGPSLISTIFVISDVITFAIQAGGGGLSISKDIKLAKIGGNIFLAGIAAQMASFILFSSLWAMFAYRAYAQDKVLWNWSGWKSLHFALGFTCVCFLIRSVYRTIELSQGYAGYLATHERYFLALDTLPLFLGIVVYTYFWPGRYLTKETKVVKDDVEVASAASRTEAVGLEVPAGPAMVERSPSRI